MIILIAICCRPSCEAEQAFGTVLLSGIALGTWETGLAFLRGLGWQVLADGRLFCRSCARKH